MAARHFGELITNQISAHAIGQNSFIEKGGLDLTQMNLTLLKKVEELTLHAIAQNKQLEAQAAQIQAQNERLQALEANRN